MKMKEIIDKVSELYRDVASDIAEISLQRTEVKKKIITADYNCGEDITLAEYNRLKQQERELQRERDMRLCYQDGISEVREMLMDLGFDTEVE